MAWNEPGGGDKDPWKRGPGGNQGPPDLDEALRKLQEKLARFLGSKKSPGSKGGKPSKIAGSFWWLVLGVLTALYLSIAIFTVDQKERVVILSLGKYSETLMPGLHIYFPPIEKKFQENITQIRSYNLKQQMLTEDENIVEVALSVQYNITDPKNFVLKVEDPIHSLEEATQSALRHEVGNAKMSQILTEGREKMQVAVKSRLQSYMSRYKTGLYVLKVNIESSHPPSEVQAAFDDVIRAREDEQRTINRAETYVNKVIPEARGQVKRLTQDAQGYKAAMIAQAQGRVARFNQLLSVYSKAPDITRERLYLDTMSRIFARSSKVLLDTNKESHNLLYLPLPQMGQKITAQPPASRVKPDLSGRDIELITDQVTNELQKRVEASRQGRLSR